MKKILKHHILLAALLALTACNENTYTLYKENPSGDMEREVVKTFSSLKTSDDNLNACHKARIEIMTKDKTVSKYWCEKGSPAS